jgi:lipoprotein-anchoring transpeptidase ErfK/SrfK
MSAAELGVLLDADATAAQAADVSYFAALSPVRVAPVASVNRDTLRAALTDIREQVALPPRDAGFRLVNGQVEAIPASGGRALDVDTTVNAMSANPAEVLRDGAFELVMRDVPPAVTDAAPLVAQAQALLASPLTIEAYDPIADETQRWGAPPDEWARWLTAEGGALAVRADALAVFIEARAAATLAGFQYVKPDEIIADVNRAVAALDPTTAARVYQRDRTHTVRAGESMTSIAWDYGVPYPYIQQANAGIESLSAGQQITIPSADTFLLHPVVPGKRVEVSISGNWTRVYENGALKWDWVSSTGISDSPTWPGVYQIISHEESAYAGNWNLYMPWFLGVYRPVPGSDFTNGFHGFPTRGGGQLLWERNLGRRVTYGCILLSSTNAKRLYDWAENGVVVEILP